MYIALFVHLEVLIIFNTDPNATGIRRIVDNEYEGVNKEISKMLELLQSDPTKCTNPVVDFSVRGTGDLVPVWFIDHDNEYVLSRDFYLTLIEDFLRQSKTPGGTNRLFKRYVYKQYIISSIFSNQL